MIDQTKRDSFETDTCNQCGTVLGIYEHNVCASCEWTEEEMIVALAEMEEERAY